MAIPVAFHVLAKRKLARKCLMKDRIGEMKALYCPCSASHARYSSMLMRVVASSFLVGIKV
jgi:hypothetical protein